jgi:hypothetical protein
MSPQQHQREKNMTIFSFIPLTHNTVCKRNEGWGDIFSFDLNNFLNLPIGEIP